MKYIALIVLTGCALAQSASPKPSASPAKPAQRAGATGQNAAPSTSRAATPNAPPKPVSPEPDQGEVNGHTYTSTYFGFSYTFPEHLDVDENLMQGQEDAAKQTFLLLAAYGPSAEGRRREGVVVMADQTTSADSQEGSDWATKYFSGINPILVAHGAQPVGTVREYSFGGQKFFRADFQRNGADHGFQSILATERQGYVIGFDFVASTENQADVLAESLNSLKFKP